MRVAAYIGKKSPAGTVDGRINEGASDRPRSGSSFLGDGNTLEQRDGSRVGVFGGLGLDQSVTVRRRYGQRRRYGGIDRVRLAQGFLQLCSPICPILPHASIGTLGMHVHTPCGAGDRSGMPWP